MPRSGTREENERFNRQIGNQIFGKIGEGLGGGKGELLTKPLNVLQ